MINRRYLRVKILQALYAYHHSDSTNIVPIEKFLLKSIDKLQESYYWLLELLIAISSYTLTDAEERSRKLLPSPEDSNIDTTFANNLLRLQLSVDSNYQKTLTKYKIDWNFEPELIKTLFNQLKQTEHYQQYLLLNDKTASDNSKLLKFVFKKTILQSPLVQQIMEDKLQTWSTDKDILQAMLIKSIKNAENNIDPIAINISLTPTEDKTYLNDMLTKYIQHEEKLQDIISKKTENWETERLAITDIILMKLALIEILYCPTIPIKASMNEYIELAKEYSTPKSSSFINGILDNICIELTKENKIKKTGRGLF